MDRATLSKFEAYQDDTTRKAADPEKFKDKITWTEWEVKSKNDLSTTPKVNSVYLSYVIRYQAASDFIADFQGNFIT